MGPPRWYKPRLAADLAGPYGLSYEVICKWLLLILDLQVSRLGQAMNQVQLMLVPGLGLLSERYKTCKARCCLFERF